MEEYLDEIVILLAFANDKQEQLAQLEGEMYDIYDALWPLRKSGTAQVEIGVNTSRDKLFQYFAHPDFREKIQIFHFAGHAGSLGVQMADGRVFAAGLAEQLEGMDLVVLNGCATKGQLSYFQRRQVRAVVATPENIQDGRARLFAAHFYRSLAEFAALPKAFRYAFSVLKSLYPHDYAGELVWSRDGQRLSLEAQYEEDAYLPTSEVESSWELHLFDPDMKDWDISQSHADREAYQRFIAGLRKKEAMEYRFLRLGDFGKVRSTLRPMLKNTQSQLRASACWVRGVDGFQHNWIAGNVLNDLLDFRKPTYLYPINIDLLPEQTLSRGGMDGEAPFPAYELMKYILRKINSWREMDEDLIADDYDPISELEVMLEDFGEVLTYQPLALRIYDKIGLNSFPGVLEDFYQRFWTYLCRRLQEKARASDYPYHPIVFMFIDLVQDVQAADLMQLHPEVLARDRAQAQAYHKMLWLDQLPEINETFIQHWIQAEAQDPTLDENLIGKKFQDRYELTCNYHYYLGQDGHTTPELFFKKICSDFQLKLEYGDPDSYRLMHIKARNSRLDHLRARRIGRRDIQTF